MKSIKKITIILAVPLLLMLLSSCKKQLEEVPYSFISPNNFYKNEADALTAVNGIYSALYSWEMYLQPMWNLTMLDDDHVSGADWYLGTSGAGNPQGYWGVDGPWVGCYTIISRANTVLENVANIDTDIDADIKKRILGEAHFLRGWAYFQLVQLYGGVPLRLKSLSENPEANVARATVKEVYDAIINDFKDAETMLFPVGHIKSGELGRATSGAAKGFLAKTYLTMASGSLPATSVTVRGGQDNGYYTYTKVVVAGLEGLDSKAYYTLARDKALEVVNSNEYSLFTNFKDIWTRGNRNKQEHMWQLQSLASSLFENQIHNYFSATSTFGRGAVWATNNHFIDHEDNDTRALDGIRHNFQSSTGYNYYYPSWQAAQYQVVGGVTHLNNGTTDDRAYTIKYSDVSNPSVSQSDAFVPLLRYAEMFLIAAESENEINAGPSLNAYAYIDTIRGRAHASYAPAGMSQAQFRSFVIAERAREYTLEGVRRFDLMRWGIYLQVMNKISGGQNNISKVRSNRNLLLPIPNSELNSNKAIPENNPGW